MSDRSLADTSTSRREGSAVRSSKPNNKMTEIPDEVAAETPSQYAALRRSSGRSGGDRQALSISVLAPDERFRPVAVSRDEPSAPLFSQLLPESQQVDANR